MNNNNKILLKEQIAQKIKDVRIHKKIPRKKIATSLGMSVSNYGYIESGKNDVSVVCLAEIAEECDVPFLEVLPDYLLNLKDQTVLNINGIRNKDCQNYQINTLPSKINEMMLKNELEKAQLLLKERDKEVNYLKEEVTRLKEMFDWIKSKDK